MQSLYHGEPVPTFPKTFTRRSNHINYVTPLRRGWPLFLPKAHRGCAECELCDTEAHLLLTATRIYQIFREAVFPDGSRSIRLITLAVR